jgi:hypothetical protein
MVSNNSVTKMLPSQPLNSGKVSEVRMLGQLSRISLSSVISPAIPNSDFNSGVLGISHWVLAISQQLTCLLPDC